MIGATFSPTFTNALANLLVACAPFLIAVRVPITMVVMIPATDIATAELPPMFFWPIV